MPKILVALLTLLFLPAPSVQASKRPDNVAVAHNLQHDGRLAKRKGVPVLIVFTRPNCVYCDRVIHYYLVPMQRHPDQAGRVLIRRLDITSSKKLVDFKGKSTTQSAFAHTMKAGFAPTVMVFTPDGKLGAKPLVGLGPEDYYGGYLDQAIETARNSIHGS